MNRNLYYDLVKWITKREVRQDAEDWTRNILLTTGRQFDVQESILYQKKSGRSIPVIIQGQEQQIIELAHDHPLSGHMGQDNTYFRLKEEV